MVRLGSRTGRVQEVIPVKHRAPYSLVDVKDVSVESLVTRRRGRELVACVVGPDRSFERPWRVESPGQVRTLVERLAELGRHCPLSVAMESSGTYGDVLRQALADAGVGVRRVSAKAGTWKGVRKGDIRPSLRRVEGRAGRDLRTVGMSPSCPGGKLRVGWASRRPVNLSRLPRTAAPARVRTR